MTQPSNRSRLLRRLKWTAYAGLLVALILSAFSFSESDASAARHFSDTAATWQANPEFRSVAMDYSISGSKAMQARLFGCISARQVVMSLRSIPGLPKTMSVNPTSDLHYTLFSQGPLSAYLRLCHEQTLSTFLPLTEQLGSNTGAGNADYVAYLDSFHMDFPVVHDAGAARSVAMMIHDSDAARPFRIRDDIEGRLTPHIVALAGELNFPAVPKDMNFEQQRIILVRLDSYVHAHDPELWRTKQVNDFCCGIWAQVFGPAYNDAIIPLLTVRTAGDYGLLVTLAATAILAGRRGRSGSSGPTATGDAADVTGRDPSARSASSQAVA